MTSGLRLRRRAALLGLLALTAQAKPGWDVPQLMAALAATRSATASFTERDTSPVLSAPLISTGTLTYVAPDYLRKQTSTPAASVFTLRNGQVTLAQGGATRQFALDEDLRIAGLVEAIRGTLAGDLPALQRYYRLTLTGGAAAWRLRLVPVNPALAKFVQSVAISGSQGQVTSIATRSTDGAESLMSIHPAKAHAP